MFVMRSTYDEMEDRLDRMRMTFINQRSELERLRAKWDDLVQEINDKGGREFLDHAEMPRIRNKFTNEEIKSIIFLCHPDKHNNSDKSMKITQKLLEMR